MKTVEQAWKERGVDDDMPPPDEYINGWLDAIDEIEAERKRLLAGYREISTATDLQMRDGDLAREIAARMLGA